jgi:hypothetical protein
MASKETLESFFKSGKVFPALQDGVYNVRLKSMELIPEKTDEKGAKTAAYVRVEWQFPNGRVVVDNRFDTGFRVLCSQLMQQCKQVTALTINELFDIVTSEELTCWVSTTTYTSPLTNKEQTSRNYNFVPPKEVHVPNPQEPTVQAPEDNKPF